MNKGDIQIKICHLLNQCDGCERVKGLSQTDTSKFCTNECETGKEMHRLGKLLLSDEDKTKPELEPKLDLEVHMEIPASDNAKGKDCPYRQ